MSKVRIMRRIFLILAFFPILLFARKGTIEPTKEGSPVPWLTGPLLAPAANVVGDGAYNIEPYFFVTKNPAIYDKNWNAQSIPPQWSLSVQAPAWVGLTDWCDITFIPAAGWNDKKSGGAAWTLLDFNMQLDFQIWHQNWSDSSWIPSIKLGLRETLPTGKYRNLNPQKLSADQGGFGSWVSSLQLAFGRVFHITGYQFLNVRLVGQYAYYSSPVHVKGYNAYGGGIGANGTIHPGSYETLDLGLEYSVSRHWAFALDVVGYWQSKSKFRGYGGQDFLLRTPTTVAKAAAIEYSLAPAIEYNWNANLGMITGVWFTIVGKEISELYSFVFAVNWYK
jgi:hypothetical protein